MQTQFDCGFVDFGDMLGTYLPIRHSRPAFISGHSLSASFDNDFTIDLSGIDSVSFLASRYRNLCWFNPIIVEIVIRIILS